MSENLCLKAIPGGVISAVAPDSLAADLDLRPGDRIASINGRPLLDVLDYQFVSADGIVELSVLRDGEQLLFELDGDESDLGVEFDAPTFDGLRRCRNNCAFCFVPQNPRAARKSLFVKDDDYRYSILYGGFVTLTNLTESDWTRLAEQRLSPLNVSVQATDPDVRRRLIGNPKAPDVVEQLRRLTGLGIVVNAQVVLCPGLNDGAQLDRTISDLAELRPGVATLSVVPVGLTDVGLRRDSGVRRHTSDEARATLDQVEAWRKRFRRESGESFVHASDEFYLLAGRPVPAARQYDGFTQYSNGVGMLRTTFDELARLRRSAAARRPAAVGHATVVTGTLAAPALAPVFAEVGRLLGCEIDLLAVENRFFGPSVTVAGLLTAVDVVAAARGRDLGEVVLLSRHALDSDGERFLDDATPADLATVLGRRVEFAATLREAAAAISRA